MACPVGVGAATEGGGGGGPGAGPEPEPGCSSAARGPCVRCPPCVRYPYGGAGAPTLGALVGLAGAQRGPAVSLLRQIHRSWRGGRLAPLKTGRRRSPPRACTSGVKMARAESAAADTAEGGGGGGSGGGSGRKAPKKKKKKKKKSRKKGRRRSRHGSGRAGKPVMGCDSEVDRQVTAPPTKRPPTAFGLLWDHLPSAVRTSVAQG